MQFNWFHTIAASITVNYIKTDPLSCQLIVKIDRQSLIAWTNLLKHRHRHLFHFPFAIAMHLCVLSQHFPNILLAYRLARFSCIDLHLQTGSTGDIPSPINLPTLIMRRIHRNWMNYNALRFPKAQTGERNWTDDFCASIRDHYLRLQCGRKNENH